jgi:hypothetical protein
MVAVVPMAAVPARAVPANRLTAVVAPTTMANGTAEQSSMQSKREAKASRFLWAKEEIARGE